VPALLFDEGLPGARLAQALRALGLEAEAVGERGRDSPRRGGSDAENSAWCAERGAVLVTNDWGRKDPAIHAALASHKVGAVFIDRKLRAAEPADLAMALLRARTGIAELAAKRAPISHKLRPNGKLVRRG
jgi:hypothetical protein